MANPLLFFSVGERAKNFLAVLFLRLDECEISPTGPIWPNPDVPGSGKMPLHFSHVKLYNSLSTEDRGALGHFEALLSYMAFKRGFREGSLCVTKKDDNKVPLEIDLILQA